MKMKIKLLSFLLLFLLCIYPAKVYSNSSNDIDEKELERIKNNSLIAMTYEVVQCWAFYDVMRTYNESKGHSDLALLYAIEGNSAEYTVYNLAKASKIEISNESIEDRYVAAHSMYKSLMGKSPLDIKILEGAKEDCQVSWVVAEDLVLRARKELSKKSLEKSLDVSK